MTDEYKALAEMARLNARFYGHSAEGVRLVQLADAIERLSAQVAEHDAQLLDIVDEQEQMVRAARAEQDKANALLAEHHLHHLSVGEIGLPDGVGGVVWVNSADAYSESSLYDRTEAYLDAHQPEPTGADHDR